MLYCGVDCGNSGGIAVLDDKDELWTYNYSEDMIHGFAKKLSKKKHVIYIEDARDAVRAPFGQKFINVKHYYKQGWNSAYPVAALRQAGCNVVLIPPKKWQEYLNLIGESKEGTAGFIVDILELDFDFFMTPRGRLEDGKSDAAGIAYYARCIERKKKRK